MISALLSVSTLSLIAVISYTLGKRHGLSRIVSAERQAAEMADLVEYWKNSATDWKQFADMSTGIGTLENETDAFHRIGR